jgi:hypothetical protein
MLDVCTDFIADAKAGLNGMRPKELCSACQMCDDHGRDMKLYQETQPGAVPSRLSRALIAVLGLNTAVLAGVSPYGGCNEALRSADRFKCKPYVKFIWFLMHALAKCERYVGGNVYRGVKADLRAQYPKDLEVTWFQFSSTGLGMVLETFFGLTRCFGVNALLLRTNFMEWADRTTAMGVYSILYVCIAKLLKKFFNEHT